MAPASQDIRLTAAQVSASIRYGRVEFYSGPNAGARLTRETVCTDCGHRPEADHVFTADMQPDMAGAWRHTDCTDPILAAKDEN